ncbi:hypothetical protein BKA65DRAFT_28046 [Rhexocercosporidium sp. MPI-PUGE-AT-0058]|nr:hypothetical protein BKA65DRAFT_28046 [Rhexocercosporidium sp. MPI-PUGE-AT-0058]
MAWHGPVKPGSRILDYYHLKYLKLPGRIPCDAFVVKYKDARVYNISANRWTEASPNSFALRDHFSRRWEERKDPFWWSAIAHKFLESKRVVRSYATRKLRQAFTESLRKKGFAPDGNVLDGRGGKPLTGSAQLTPLEPILKTRQSDLVLQTDVAVEHLLKVRDGGLNKQAAGFNKGSAGRLNKNRQAEKKPKVTQGFTITKKRM